MAEIQRKAINQSGRNPAARLLHAKNDKETIAAWKLDLNRILHTFNVRSIIPVWLLLTGHFQTELAMNTHVIASDIHHGVVTIHNIISNVHDGVANTHAVVSDIHRNMLKSQEGTDDQLQLVSDFHPASHHQMNKWSPPPRHKSGQQPRLSMNSTSLIFASSVPGESPPPPPRDVFGRDELIEKIVGLAENLTPFALIGAGGIGKTSIALTVLHDNRIKQRFGDNRRFIRCDQFPTSLTHLLRWLSKVVGAGAENSEDLTPLRPFLSSKEMFIILDNAESILDPQGTDAQEIYAAVEELSQFNNICLGVTSCITTIPPACQTLDIPTLSTEAANDTFHCIYKNGEQTDSINNILKQLDFHPLSITLLATVAHQNRWDTDRLTKEWERQRTDALHTRHNKSLAATIELSLASPMFQELGPGARELLGVVAFFPQGVNEDNIEWLFPALSDGTNIFNTFCVLSLTYRSHGFITMLAPLRDHLCPRDPKSSPLLCTTKECYFARLSVGVHPGKPGFEGSRWIKSEDVNTEHLLHVFTITDSDSNGVWDVCSYFMEHLYFHKPRLVLLGPKIEALLDTHPSKPRCLLRLSHLLNSVGNYTECKQLLTHTLKLWREQGDDFEVAQTLGYLSDANRLLGLHKEGVQQAKEALKFHEQLNDTFGRAHSLRFFARLLYDDQQPDAAKEAALQSINLLQGEVDRSLVCQCRRLLGEIHSFKGEMEKAIDHFEAALVIASSLDWCSEQFWGHYQLAELCFDRGRFDDSQAHIGRAKSQAANNVYLMGCATHLQAWLWYKQHRFGEARSEALCAINLYEKAGAMADLERCGSTLRGIEKGMEEPNASRIGLRWQAPGYSATSYAY